MLAPEPAASARSCVPRGRSPSASIRVHEPSGCSVQAFRLSAISTSNTDEISSRIRRSSTGTTTSIRWSRFRGIRSALPRYTEWSAPASNENRRLCSRKRPTMLRTLDVLGEPLQPRPQSADGAGDELDRRARLGRPVERLDHGHVGQVVDLDANPGGLPLAAASATWRIRSISPERRLNGATRILRNRCGRPNPVRWLNRSAMSAVISSSSENRPKSSYSRAVTAL